MYKEIDITDNNNIIDFDKICFHVETIIDNIGLPELLCQISNVCEKKAQHARDNWQDSNLEKAWKRAGYNILKLSKKIDV